MHFPFGKKARAAADVKLGYQGKPADLFARAQVSSGSYEHKIPVVEGCVKAFNEGRPQNLQQFLAGYLAFKRDNHSIDKQAKEGLDGGMVNLVADPVMTLIEKSKEPAQVIADITEPLSGYYKQVLLDTVLRRAARRGSWYAAEALLEAGADANAGQGRPLYSAIDNNDTKIIALLYKYGVDFNVQPPDTDHIYRLKTQQHKELLQTKQPAPAQNSDIVLVNAPANTDAAQSPAIVPQKGRFGVNL